MGPGGAAEWDIIAVFTAYNDFMHTGELELFASYYPQMRNWTEAVLIDPSQGLWSCVPCGGLSRVRRWDEEGKGPRAPSRQHHVAAQLSFRFTSLVVRTSWLQVPCPHGPPNNLFNCNAPEVDWPSDMRDGFVYKPANILVRGFPSTRGARRTSTTLPCVALRLRQVPPSPDPRCRHFQMNAYVYKGLLHFVELARALNTTESRKDADTMEALAKTVLAASNKLGFNGELYIDGVGTSHTAWHTCVWGLGGPMSVTLVLPAGRACHGCAIGRCFACFRSRPVK